MIEYACTWNKKKLDKDGEYDTTYFTLLLPTKLSITYSILLLN